MKSCATHTVSDTLAQLCPTVSAKLQLRRKFQTTDSASGSHITKCWFVIHGAEDVLNELQDEWENIAVQTSWKLEECFMFKDSVQTSQQHVEHLRSHSPAVQEVSSIPTEQLPVTSNIASIQQSNVSDTNEPPSLHNGPFNNGDSSNNGSSFLGQH